jgi:hypothetical protein
LYIFPGVTASVTAGDDRFSGSIQPRLMTVALPAPSG